MSHLLANFLFAYRNTPHTTTGVTPASLFLKRLPRTQLSLLSPNLAETVENQQRQQKKYHDSPTSKLREFTNGDKVQVQVFSGKTGKWENGTIEKRLGPVTYLVRVQGKSKKTHVDHILACHFENTSNKQPDIPASETPNTQTYTHRYHTLTKHSVI